MRTPVAAMLIVTAALLSGCSDAGKVQHHVTAVDLKKLPWPNSCRASNWDHPRPLKAGHKERPGAARLSDAVRALANANGSNAINFVRAIRCECEGIQNLGTDAERAELDPKICSSEFLDQLALDALRSHPDVVENAKKAQAAVSPTKKNK